MSNINNIDKNNTGANKDENSLELENRDNNNDNRNKIMNLEEKLNINI